MVEASRHRRSTLGDNFDDPSRRHLISGLISVQRITTARYARTTCRRRMRCEQHERSEVGQAPRLSTLESSDTVRWCEEYWTCVTAAWPPPSLPDRVHVAGRGLRTARRRGPRRLLHRRT